MGSLQDFVCLIHSCYCLVTQSWCPNFLQPYELQPTSLPLPMEFPKQEYRNGLPFPSLENLSYPGIELTSPASLLHCSWILYHWASGEAHLIHKYPFKSLHLCVYVGMCEYAHTHTYIYTQTHTTCYHHHHKHCIVISGQDVLVPFLLFSLPLSINKQGTQFMWL